MTELLKLNGVALRYQTETDETEAVKNLGFSVCEGEFVSVIGPSGCGKTSVLSLIAGIIKPSEGQILLRGKPIEKPSESLGYMLQKDQLLPWRTIEKNVLLPLEIKKQKTPDKVRYAQHLLEKYGLGEFRNHYPDQLSGGMRQRAALIRTLVCNPDILLLDEPFSALDYQTRLTVCEDVYGIIKSEGKTTILVTHDISEAISVSDKIIVLTARPATVKSIYTPEWGELSPLKRREQDMFRIWFEKLWHDLNA